MSYFRLLMLCAMFVVLPAMVQELHWNWGEAGTGFSLLGVFCGITSTIPAMLIRRVGVRATLAAGAIVWAAAFACLARADRRRGAGRGRRVGAVGLRDPEGGLGERPAG